RTQRPPAGLLLSIPEGEGLLIWLYRQDAPGTRVTLQELEWECNCILATRHTGPINPPLCGVHWANRFLQRHP
ncbi:hypothetical protein K432DRAFT_312448, partial [Lepidopterella palustris CBS 459.81]